MRGQPAIRESIEISKEETLFWKNWVRSSLQRQKKEFIGRIGYEELIRYFEALQLAEEGNINQIAIVDEFSPALISVISETYNQNPKQITKPTHPLADGVVQPSIMYLMQHPEFKPYKLADLMGSAIDYGMEKVGMKNEMQLADFDLLVAGFACVEMNYASEPAEDTAMTDTAEAGNPILDKIGEVASGVFNSIKKALTPDETAEKIAGEVQDEKIDFTDATYCKRWNPLDILFDPEAVVFLDSIAVGKRVRMSIAQFNIKYPKFKGKIGANSSMALDMPYQAQNNPEHKKGVELYQIEIKKKSGRNCILTLANGIEEAVDYYEDPIITNGFKVKYGCIDKYGKLYPMSRAKKAKKPQDDINHYMTVQFEHVDRAMRKIAVYMQGLSESGKSAQRSADVYAIVEKLSPQPVYEAMPAPSVVPENKEIVLVMKDSINKSVGTSELQKSGKSDNDLLGQDQLANQAFQSNANAVTDALGDMSDELLDTMKDIIMQVWDGEDYFKVTGVTGGDQWYDPSMGPLAEILVGDFKVKSDIATAARPNPLKDRQDSIEYAKIITDPMMVQFAAMHGKRPTMSVLNNLAKQFGQSPEATFEDLEMPPLDPMAPPMEAPGQAPPNTIPIPQAAANG